MKDIFVARQPIFDPMQKVVGYELLYRSNGHVGTAGDFNPHTMSSSVIVDGIVGMGLDLLTEGQRAFINLSEELLLDGTAELLDPSSVVIEILEHVRATPAVIAKCQELKSAGYTLALDDFEFDYQYAPLLELADIVKVDVIEMSDRLKEMAITLEPFDVTLLAEKVEDQAAHEDCVQAGFELFQGFHYFRPETVTKKDVSAQSVSIIRLMNMIRDPGMTDRQIEDAFRADPSLTFKLLKIVNSAALGGRGVQSIAHALRLLGRDPLYRWLSLLLMSVGTGGGEIRLELIKDALMRARMCEELGDQIRSALRRDVPSGGSLFLVGLFSHIDQLLGIDVAEILAEIDVAQEVRDALLERAGSGGRILRAVEAYAEAEWDDAGREIAHIGGSPEVLGDTYLDAITWAGARMAMHGNEDAA